MEEKPKIVDVEVVVEPPKLDRPLSAIQAQQVEQEGFDAPPIHALSALLLVTVDNLWNLADWTVVGWPITIPAAFCTVAFPTFLVQKYLKKDSTGKALAFAVLLGTLAAIPTSITGTPVGIALLAWTGLSRLLNKIPGK